MAIELPSTTGNIQPEYAANQSSVMRTNLQIADGTFETRFSASISYNRTDFILSNGKKVAIVQPPQFIYSPENSENPYVGMVGIDAATLAADFSADPGLAMAFQKVADYEDGKILADLIRRGIKSK